MEEKPIKKNFNWKEKKESTICSLYEVEHFLCNFRQIWKGIEFYKFFKH